MTWENVREEPPQKCRNMRVGAVPEIVTLRAVSVERVNVLLCDIFRRCNR